MDRFYQSVTDAAIETIEAMASSPHNNAVCDVQSLRLVAAGVYWSWACLVGSDARDEDSDRMENAIRKIMPPNRPTPRWD